MSELHKNSAWKNQRVPRGKHHNRAKCKTTVSLYLSRTVVERARSHKLNLTRVQVKPGKKQ